MSRLPFVRPREVCRVLEKVGFSLARQRGSHAQFKKANLLVTVPMHSGDLQPDTLRSILRQAKMTAEEMKALL